MRSDAQVTSDATARADESGGRNGSAGLRPPVIILLALVVVAIWLLFLEPIGRPRTDSQFPVAGADRQLVVALEPDSVRVGEPFVLGLTLRSETPGEVQFPPLLTLSDEVEQTGGAEIRGSEDQLEWRAYYPLVAWRARQVQIPEFSIAMLVAGADAPREVAVQPPAIEVLSVLPDSTDEELELREARPLLRIRGPHWAWLLLAVLALAPLWYWWNRRASLAAMGPPLSPGERALQALTELRVRSKRGELSGAELFDGVEGTLRGYVQATKAWRPGRALEELGQEDSGLAGALARSALARFARLKTSLESSLAAIDSAIGFVRRDSEPEPETEAAESAGSTAEVASDSETASDSNSDSKPGPTRALPEDHAASGETRHE